jgi:hypothetical protein
VQFSYSVHDFAFFPALFSDISSTSGLHMAMNVRDKSRRMWKEAVVDSICLAKLSKNMEILSRDS